MKKKIRNNSTPITKRTTDNIHSGHRRRLRSLFLTTHPSSLSDHQLLEMLLFHVIPRADTNETAHLLLETFGSLSGVLNAQSDHLKKVDGIGEKSALLIKLVLEIMRRAHIEREKGFTKIDSLEEVGNYFIKKFAFETTEAAILVCVNKNKRIISTHRLKYAISSKGASPLDEILSICVAAKPHTVILAHFHPDACDIPSRADELFTYSLQNSLEALRVLLIEHFVVTRKEYTRIINKLDYNYPANLK